MLKQALRFSVILIFCFLSNDIFAKVALPPPILPIPIIQETYYFNNIEALVISGNIHLRLIPTKPGQPNYYHINANFLPWVQVFQQNGTLHIQAIQASTHPNAKEPPLLNLATPIPVTVAINQLYELVLNDNSTVIGTHFNVPDLHLVANTIGTINLRGSRLGIEDLMIGAPAIINLAGINSSALSITNNNNANITLAGTVRYLQARLSGQSHLDATHLTAQVGFIKTCNQAQARVNVTQRLNAFAHDQSLIFYYSDPLYRIEYSSESGNVLPLE